MNDMKYIFLLLLLVPVISLAQDENDDWENESVLQGTELGIDITASGSNFGGDVGLGLKYGVNLGQYFIVGPSARYEYIWWKNYVGGSALSSGGSHIFGGGLFAHARFYNAIFLGVEFEMLKSPYSSNGFINQTQGSWAPTLFVGGGYSQEFNEKIRVHLGIMYDVIDANNSPFKRSYVFQKKDAYGNPAGFLPIIYRLAFFFPLT